MANIVRAKRLGWNEGPTGNVTRIDILDPYDYDDDDLEGDGFADGHETAPIGCDTQL